MRPIIDLMTPEGAGTALQHQERVTARRALWQLSGGPRRVRADPRWRTSPERERWTRCALSANGSTRATYQTPGPYSAATLA